MFRHPACGFILMLMLLPVFCSAQNKKESRLKTCVDELHQAMVNADSAGLSRMVLPELSYVHSNGEVDYKAGFISRITSGRSDFLNIKTAEAFFTISKKTGIVRFLMIADTNDNGKPGKLELRVMQVWQMRGGKWLLLARQSSRRV